MDSVTLNRQTDGTVGAVLLTKGYEQLPKGAGDQIEKITPS
jgi:hypothetical protein